ncbi:MAG: peptidylprolyl isomerase, partial [Bacteroidales bacterium]
MVNEFSEAAFSLLHDGDISEPVKTIYGWHVIKRLEKQPLQPFDEARKTLEGKLSQSYLLSLSRKSFAEKLKKEYNFRINRDILNWFYSIADSTFRSGNINARNMDIPGGSLYTFADRSCSPAQFLDFIREKGPQGMETDSIRFINSLLDTRSYEDLIKYEDSILEKKYPEFRYLVNEFHDGILLFEISDSLVWSRAVNDTAGLREFYETIKTKFLTAPEAHAV